MPPMEDMWGILVILGAWFIIQSVILPRLGVPT